MQERFPFLQQYKWCGYPGTLWRRTRRLGFALSGTSRGALSCRLPETRRKTPASAQAQAPQHSQKKDVRAQKLPPCWKRDSVAPNQASELPQKLHPQRFQPCRNRCNSLRKELSNQALPLAWLACLIAALRPSAGPWAPCGNAASEGGEPFGIEKHNVPAEILLNCCERTPPVIFSTPP